MSKKISDYDPITTRNNDDWLLIEEASTGAYKRIKVSDFIAGLFEAQTQDDPYFANVVLLMPMDGISGNATFMDIKGKAFSSVGNPVLSSSQFKFGSTSASFNGSSKIYTSDSADWNFGSGDFTIEMWLRLNDTSNPQCILGQHNNSINSNRSFAIYYANGIKLFPSVIGAFDGGLTLQDTNTLSADTWYHITVTRETSSLNLYVDGVKKATNTNIGSTALFDSSLPLSIGSDDSNTHYLNGFIDDLRITKGVNRYTSTSFTLPTSANPTH